MQTPLVLLLLLLLLPVTCHYSCRAGQGGGNMRTASS
jgi:hypothetical protein